MTKDELKDILESLPDLPPVGDRPDTKKMTTREWLAVHDHIAQPLGMPEVARAVRGAIGDAKAAALMSDLFEVLQGREPTERVQITKDDARAIVDALRPLIPAATDIDKALWLLPRTTAIWQTPERRMEMLRYIRSRLEESFDVPEPDLPRLTGQEDRFRWKPVSEHGSLVVLLPAEYTDRTSKVLRILDANGNEVARSNRAHNPPPGQEHPNGNREHYRFPKPGAQYPKAVRAVIEVDGSYHIAWNIPDPGKDYKDSALKGYRFNGAGGAASATDSSPGPTTNPPEQSGETASLLSWKGSGALIWPEHWKITRIVFMEGTRLDGNAPYIQRRVAGNSVDMSGISMPRVAQMHGVRLFEPVLTSAPHTGLPEVIYTSPGQSLLPEHEGRYQIIHSDPQTGQKWRRK